MGGQTSISYIAISRYADDYGIAGEEFQLFRRYLTALDSEWLKHVAEEATRKEAQNG